MAWNDHEKDSSLQMKQLVRLIRTMRCAGMAYENSLSQFRASFVEHVIAAHHAHLGRAARELQMHPNTLTRLIRELKIDINRLRSEYRGHSS